MKILKIIHGYPPDYQAGSEVYSRLLCETLAARGLKVDVFTREENPFRPDFELRSEHTTSGVTLWAANMPREKDGYLHPALDAQFEQLTEDLRPDVAHVGHLNHLSTGIIRVLKKRRVPIVFTLHDYWLMCPRGQFLQTNFAQKEYFQPCDGQENDKCAKNCYRAYWGNSCDDPQAETAWTEWIKRRMDETRAICALTDLFIAPSQTLRARFIQDFNVSPDKIIYLNYGFRPVKVSFFAQESPHSVFTFGYIGTHIPAKGVQLLLEAFAQVKPQCRLWIWGRENAHTAFLKRLAKQCANEVAFKGEYPNESIEKTVIPFVDCIITPSIWNENSPLVIHEAQTYRKPVITANVGGMAEYVQHGVNGLLFEHRNALSLAEKLTYAVQNPDAMKKFGRRGYLYTPDGAPPAITTHADEIIKLYHQVITRRNG